MRQVEAGKAALATSNAEVANAVSRSSKSQQWAKAWQGIGNERRAGIALGNSERNRKLAEFYDKQRDLDRSWLSGVQNGSLPELRRQKMVRGIAAGVGVTGIGGGTAIGVAAARRRKKDRVS
jgi:hypothetical protein